MRCGQIPLVSMFDPFLVPVYTRSIATSLTAPPPPFIFFSYVLLVLIPPSFFSATAADLLEPWILGLVFIWQMMEWLLLGESPLAVSSFFPVVELRLTLEVVAKQTVGFFCGLAPSTPLSSACPALCRARSLSPDPFVRCKPRRTFFCQPSGVAYLPPLVPFCHVSGLCILSRPFLFRFLARRTPCCGPSRRSPVCRSRAVLDFIRSELFPCFPCLPPSFFFLNSAFHGSPEILCRPFTQSKAVSASAGPPFPREPTLFNFPFFDSSYVILR